MPLAPDSLQSTHKADNFGGECGNNISILHTDLG